MVTHEVKAWFFLVVSLLFLLMICSVAALGLFTRPGRALADEHAEEWGKPAGRHVGRTRPDAEGPAHGAADRSRGTRRAQCASRNRWVIPRSKPRSISTGISFLAGTSRRWIDSILLWIRPFWRPIRNLGATSTTPRHAGLVGSAGVSTCCGEEGWGECANDFRTYIRNHETCLHDNQI